MDGDDDGCGSELLGVTSNNKNTVNVEILAIHLIWRFGDEQQNRQI